MRSILKNSLASLILTLICATPGLAFHDGGVAECAGCHTMHNSQNDSPVDPNNVNGNSFLLNNGNSSDTCLRCHAAYGQFLDGAGYGPGGDFAWITKTFSWTAHGNVASSEGDSHGHNVQSSAFGISADATLTSAPGGDFQSQYLKCTSCHDPHGNQDFRLLYGSNFGPDYNGGRYAFSADAPLAKGNSRRTTVGLGNGNETDAKHTVYKSGMSDWCANCHENLHSDNSSNFIHPIGQLGSTIAALYNSYVSTDDVTGGNVGTSYMGLVPFEVVNVDLSTVNSENYTMGPDGAAEVMCLTCHRAHASAYQDATRWDMSETFLVDSHPNPGDIDFVQSDVDHKDYDYIFTANQRSLCNKCHQKDFGDNGLNDEVGLTPADNPQYGGSKYPARHRG